MENIKCSLPGKTAGAAAFPLHRRWPVLVPWLLYWAVIFYFSSQSRFFLQPPEFFSSDKMYHFLEYAFLGVLTVRVVRAYRPRWSPGRQLLGATLFCLLYGLGDEFHQWFVPGRWASLGDVGADTFGGWAGARLYAWRMGSSRAEKGPDEVVVE